MAFPASPVNNQIASRFGRYFRYNASVSRWEVVISPSVNDIQSASLNAVGDIDLTSNPPSNGQALTWNASSGKFIPANLGSGTTAYATLSELPLSNNESGSKALVAENNTLYMWNGTGWYKIALVNTNPTITTEGDASYELNIDGTPTVITLEANDPEGVPITWSYTVTSGALEDTTVTNADNVFTVTPGATETSFTLSFIATDGVGVATSVASFVVETPTVILKSTLGNLAANLTGTLQPNGDYLITGTAHPPDSGARAASPPITNNVYGEFRFNSGMGSFQMYGFSADLNVSYETTNRTQGWIFNGYGHFSSNTGMVNLGSLGYNGEDVGDIIQFGLDVSTRTFYYSKNDSSAIYSYTLAGTGDIHFVYGSGAASNQNTVYNLTLRSLQNQVYKNSFESKTGVSFNAGVWQ